MLEKILGNFTRVAQNDGKFPVVAGTLEKLQNNTELIAYLGNVLGQKYVILAGCVQTGNRRSEGYVYVRNSDNEPGNILYYPGASAVSPYCYVKSVDENIVAAGEPFKSAYTKKSLSDGLPSGGETKILWSDFVVGSEIFALQNHQHSITEVKELSNTFVTQKRYNDDITKIEKKIFVKGMIIMWGGNVSDIPFGWKLCDGNNGTPNLKDRFVVGAGGTYNKGATGGAATVTLTLDQIPSHSHGANSEIDQHTHTLVLPKYKNGSGKGGDNDCDEYSGTVETSTSLYTHSHKIYVGNTGGGKAHNNLPPYYALCFIMYWG